MNKQSTAILILILFLSSYVIPSASAISETFVLSKNEIKNITIELKQGEEVKGHITSLGSINSTNPSWHQSLIIFKIIDPEGSSVKIFNSYWEDVAISDSNFAFTAESSGSYTFKVVNSVFPDKNQTISLSYNVTPKYGIALPSRLEGLFDQISIYGPFIVIIISLVVATISLVRRAKKYSEKVKSGAIQSPSDLEKTIDTKIATINKDTPVSETDRKRGILLRCKNAWLSDTTFYYVLNSWKISDMTEASVGKYGVLLIRFKDGKTHKFRLLPLTDVIESAAGEAVYLSSENAKLPPSKLENWAAGIGGIRKLVKNMNQQWAATINELINRQTQSTQTLS